jgi:hypothetical protein
MPLEVMRRLPGDRASDTLRRSMLHGGIGRLLNDGLRDLGVRVTALVQRAAREYSDACRCCQLPADALARSAPLSLYARCLCRYIMQPMSIECIYVPPEFWWIHQNII